MSEEGVSSIAVVDDYNANLLSAVSVTDIGKVCSASSSSRICSTNLSDRCTVAKQSNSYEPPSLFRSPDKGLVTSNLQFLAYVIGVLTGA